MNIGVKINDNNLNRNSFLGISNGYDSNQRHTIQS